MVFEKLIQMEQNRNPIRVAIIGAGHMGGGTVHQISRMKGIEASILAELDVGKALAVYETNGISKDSILITNNPDDAQDAILRGKPVVTEDGELAANVAAIDAVVEATGLPAVGARVAYASIMGGKHTVMLNVEADVVIGPILAKLANTAGVVYSIAAGDQPGAICELYDWAVSLGFEVVTAGRGTWSRPGCHYLTPESFIDLEKEMGGSAKMYCSFHDGTKPNIEMAVTANVLGLVPDVSGMHEPFAYVHDLHTIFSLKKDGGILSNIRIEGTTRTLNVGHVISTAPMYKETVLKKESMFFDLARVLYDYPKIDGIIRAHLHSFVHLHTRGHHAVMLPCWKAYDPGFKPNRMYAGIKQSDIGGVLFIVDMMNRITVHHFLMDKNPRIEDDVWNM